MKKLIACTFTSSCEYDDHFASIDSSLTDFISRGKLVSMTSAGVNEVFVLTVVIEVDDIKDQLSLYRKDMQAIREMAQHSLNGTHWKWNEDIAKRILSALEGR